MASSIVLKLLLLTAVIAAGLLFIGFTGVFVVPTYELATSCDTCVLDGEVLSAQTLWYWRGSTRYPFVASDGGNLMRLKDEGFSFGERIEASVAARSDAFNRKLFAFPYSEFLYKITTGGRAPKKYDSVF